MRVLISGGTGFIGQAVVASVNAKGHDVTVLTRRKTVPAGWDPFVNLIEWDSAKEELPPSTFEGIDAVINLAGESIGQSRWSNTRKDLLFQSRVGTTRRLVEAIEKSTVKPKVFISASAVGFYGPHDSGDLSEADQAGTDFLAMLCSHWEDAAKKVIRHGVRLVLPRFGMVLEKSGGALPRMMLPFKFFAGGPVGSGKQVISWIHRDDAVGLIRYALENDGVSGPLNATAPQPVTNREFAGILGKVMGRPSLMPTPAFAMRLAFGEMADLLLTGQRVLPKRALEYGYEFRYPELDGALRAILTRE